MKELQKESKHIDKKYCVYKHTSPSGKCYIGITCLNPIRRWGRYGQKYWECKKFYHAILKYGWDNFQHEILYTDLSEMEAKNIEIQLIAFYKNLGISYNISNGGDGCSKPTSEETRKKISNKLKGRKSYERTPEWRKRASEFMKTHPIFTDTMRTLAHENSAKVLSKKVVQYNLDHTLVREYKSIREASRFTGFDASYISKCCRGIKEEAYGFIWKFKVI